MERFWTKVHKTDTCWLWTAALRCGYGAFKVDGKAIGAHCYSYAMAHGAIPKGLVVCHSCDVRHCVNPDHLWLGSYKDNMQDASRKGRIVPTNKKHATRQVALHVYYKGWYARHKAEHLKRKRDRYHRLKASGISSVD